MELEGSRDGVARQGRLLSRVTTGVFGVVAAAALFELVATGMAAGVGVVLLKVVPYRLAMPFYLVAIWMVRRAFVQLANGAVFDDVLPPLLMRLGVALTLGAITTTFVSPMALSLLSSRSLAHLAMFDPPAIAVGLVGVLLTTLSKLMRRAAAMQLELDEIL